MSFKQHLRAIGWRSVSGVVLLALLGAGQTASASKSAVPSVRLPLADLGFPGYPVALMHAGASMATIHVLDRSHLLFTYGLRKLVPRLPGDDGNDHDRLVGAEVVEVPSGKILARTEWHLHDYGRYLWCVGHGVFVLRSANELSFFEPLRGLAAGKAFERTALLHREGHPEMVTNSPDGEIVTVELQKQDETQEAEGDEQPRRKHTVIEFYRLVLPKDTGGNAELRPAGLVGSPGLLRLALDGDGYLWSEDPARGSRWSVSFNEYEGKAQELAAVDSTCSPHLELLSRSEFAVLSCGASEDSQMLAAYGFDGHENWEEHVGGDLQPPAFVTAPAAGRFAMSRLSASSGGSPAGMIGAADGAMTQEIRVYGTESGDLLLSLQCLPVARTPENFDLSADGRTLAVLGNDSINLYTLPELSARDRKDLADAATMTPPLGSGPVALRRITRPVVEEDAVSSEETTAPQRPLIATPSAGGTAADANAGPRTPGRVRLPDRGVTTTTSQAQGGTPGANGDDHAAPRKPPTLLAPGEKQEYKDPTKTPE